MCCVCLLGERCSFILLKYMYGLKDWNQAHSLVWFIPPWTIRTWGFLQQRAVCTVHCIECTLMLQKIITKEVGAGCPVVILELDLALHLLSLSRYFYTFYKLLYTLVKHRSLAHWNLPWQNQIVLTYKLFLKNRKKILSKCILLRVHSLLPNTSWWGHWVPTALVFGWTPPLGTGHCKAQASVRAALCLQNRGITFVP